MSDIKYQAFFKAVTEVIEGICTHPDDLKIFEEDGVLNVYPHQADYPKLVGAKGRTVNAIKHLFVRAAVNLNVRIAFNLEQSFVGRREERIPFSYNPDFDLEKLRRLVREVTGTVFRSATEEIRVNGEDISINISSDRNEDNHTTAAAMNALFYPYGFAQGRMISVKLSAIT